MRRAAFFLLITLIQLGISRADGQTLKFEKRIGVPWKKDQWGWMSFVAFSPDGKQVASDNLSLPNSHSLSIWSFPDGKVIRSLPIAPNVISDDWKYFVDERGVGEMESGKLLITPVSSGYRGFVLSRDNHLVAESSPTKRRKPAIRIVELSTGRQVGAFGTNAVSGLAFSPDGETLATGYLDVVILRDVHTGERKSVLRGFGRYAGTLAFSPDGTILAAATDVGELQLWSMRDFTRLHSIEVEGYPSDLKFSPDGKLVAVGTYGTGTAWLIDVTSGRIVDHQRVSDMGCGSVAFSPDGQFLITPSTGGLITWPYDRGGTIRVFRVERP